MGGSANTFDTPMLAIAAAGNDAADCSRTMITQLFLSRMWTGTRKGGGSSNVSSAYLRAQTEFSHSKAFEQFQAHLSAEDAQARKRFEEEQASERLVSMVYRADDLAPETCQMIS
ncbi:hypothetical protein Tco_1408508 [Tanacetum coccineum]